MLEENERLRQEGLQPAKFERSCWVSPKPLWLPKLYLGSLFPGDHASADRSCGDRQADPLRGLKENVVVGRLIPAGTGLAYHAQRKQERAAEGRYGNDCG